MLNNKAWQPIKGMEDALIYPVINKTSIITSNSFIIQTPKIIILIDPGDLPEQIAAISLVIRETMVKGQRPVFVYLTHCHVDHCFEFLLNPSNIAPNVNVFVAIQENGFDAVYHKDRELTGSGRSKKMIPDPNIDICLLSVEDRRFSVIKKLQLCMNMQLEVSAKSLMTPLGNLLFMQEISFNGETIKAYYTPGHSPDSVSFQTGDILFTGDFLLAADYFVAGIPGWSKKLTLESAKNLLWLIEKEKVTIVAQGHGEYLTSDKASERLKKMINNLPGINVKKELDFKTMIASSEHAVDVSKEAVEIMTEIAESLSRVVHYLEFLEESEEASRYTATLDPNKLAKIFSSFNEMACDMHSGKLIEAGLVLKSAVLFNKIRGMLKAENLDSVVSQGLINRLERLFDDFMKDSGGEDVKQNLEVFEVEDFLENFIKILKKDMHSDETIFDTLDDQHAFIQSLARRIAYKSTFKFVEFSIACENLILIRSDKNRLHEIIEIFIEMLVEEGSKKVVFGITEDQGFVNITMEGGMIPKSLIAEGYQKRSLLRRLKWINSSYNLKIEENSELIVIAIPSSE